jgi:hypothetical protein
MMLMVDVPATVEVNRFAHTASRDEIPMNETSLVDLGGGHILAFVRTGDSVDHMYRAESVNGGITWGRLRDFGITGHPPDLLKLRNGHVLLTYGYLH